MLMKRKALTYFLISLLAVSILASTGFLSLKKANGFQCLPFPEKLPTGQAYIRSNGDVDPPTLPIQRAGNMYVLKDNILNYSIKIEKDNVVIDGAGFLMKIPAYGETDKNYLVKAASPLIQISNKSNIIIKNMIFDNYLWGISIINSSNIIIIQNTINNGNTGIYMLQSANCNLVANQIGDNSLRGALIQDCTSLNILYNEISNNQYAGIEVDDLTRSIFDGLEHTNITRNLFAENGYAGLYFLGHHTNNHIFENNFINNNNGLCFMHVASVNNSFNNNYWKGNRMQINDYGTNRTDQSPLASPVSTSFDPSLFPLPSPTLTSSPELKSTSEPFPITLVATSTVSVVAIGIGLLLYFKKRKH